MIASQLVLHANSYINLSIAYFYALEPSNSLLHFKSTKDLDSIFLKISRPLLAKPL